MIKRLRNNKAFTLIELIVVVGIVGILVGIAQPKYTGFTDKARAAKIKNDIRVVESIVDSELVRESNPFSDESIPHLEIKDLADERKLYDTKGSVNSEDVSIDETYYLVKESIISKSKSKLKGKFYSDSKGKVFYEDLKPGNTEDEDPVTRYSVTVEGGSGSGEYAPGDEVSVSAEVPEGLHFEKWVSDGLTIKNNSENLSFIMPENDVTLTLNSIKKYNVSVNGGSGSGFYKPGETVFISSEENSDYVVEEWISRDVDIKVDKDGKASFVMPESNVTIDSNSIYLAKDSDFEWIASGDRRGYRAEGKGLTYGYYKYVGSEKVVKIPTVISGTKLNSYYNMFHESDVKKVVSDNKNIVNMAGMFRGTTSTSLDLSGLDTSNVRNMNSMFAHTNAFYIDLKNFDTSNVTEMSSIFTSTNKLVDLDLRSFDMSKVTKTDNMFRYNYSDYIYARSETDLEKLKNSSGQTGDAEFSIVKEAADSDFTWESDNNGYLAKNESGKGYYKYIGSEKAIKIPNIINGHEMTSYYKMFYGSRNIVKVDSNNRNIENMNQMFRDATSDKLDVMGLETSSVTNMYQMFFRTKVEVFNLSNFDMSNVVDTDHMFYYGVGKEGYARTKEDAEKLNNSSNKPSRMVFKVL